MKKKSAFATVCLLLLFSATCFAQVNTDTVGFTPTAKHHFARQFAIPVALIGLGVYGTTDNMLINHDAIKAERFEYFAAFSHKADNYFQYAPIAVVYAFDAFGLKGEHNWKQQTLLLGSAELIMTGIVIPVKKYTHILRPDSSAYNSFPSGHTAQAFVAAAFFHKEFGKKYPWVSAGMFTLAAGIGTFRILNNKHWISDVLAGAGVGILSVELSYALLKNKGRYKKVLPSVVIPGYSKGVFLCTAIYKI